MTTKLKAKKKTVAPKMTRFPVFIMAGGKGSRIGLQIEKPLIPFLGKPLIEWVVGAVKAAKRVSKVYIVTSENTLVTERICVKNGLEVVRTDGKGYHDDLKQAMSKIQIKSPVLIVSSDLPALTGKFLDKVISFYEEKSTDALTVLVPSEKRKEKGLSISSTYPFEGVLHCVSGVNIINASKIFEEKIKEYALITDKIEAVININTLQDLEIAEKILRKP